MRLMGRQGVGERGSERQSYGVSLTLKQFGSLWLVPILAGIHEAYIEGFPRKK
jgi:hypothetical protein